MSSGNLTIGRNSVENFVNNDVDLSNCGGGLVDDNDSAGGSSSHRIKKGRRIGGKRSSFSKTKGLILESENRFLVGKKEDDFGLLGEEGG